MSFLFVLLGLILHLQSGVYLVWKVDVEISVKAFSNSFENAHHNIAYFAFFGFSRQLLLFTEGMDKISP
jgi:hypothetical protein